MRFKPFPQNSKYSCVSLGDTNFQNNNTLKSQWHNTIEVNDFSPQCLVGCLPCDDFRTQIPFIQCFCHPFALESFTYSWWMGKRDTRQAWSGHGAHHSVLLTRAQNMALCDFKSGWNMQSHCKHRKKRIRTIVVVSQPAHSSGHQISLHSSIEHLSLPHGRQPKDPSILCIQLNVQALWVMHVLSMRIAPV